MSDPVAETDVSGEGAIDEYDIVVVGCGMAGLSTAISASERGKSVLVLEKAPKAHRGGQTQHTGIVRFPTAEVDMDIDFAEPDYTPEDFYDDIMDVTEGRADPDILQTLVTEAASAFEWLTEHMYQFDFRWTGKRSKKKGGEFVGYVAPGGRWSGNVDVLVKAAEAAGADIVYEAEARGLRTRGRRVTGVDAIIEGEDARISAKAVVIAAGGFESSTEKRTAYMGQEYDDMIVRGVRYNTGEAIDMALDIGAQSDGNWSGAHTSMVNANAPEVGSGVNSFHGYHYGIVINHDGERFLDEGEDWRSKTYAKFGHEVIEQPHKEAFVIMDGKTDDVVVAGEHGFYERVEADSIERLVEELGIDDPERAIETYNEYNTACDETPEWDPRVLDGKSTTGIVPKKSNWAVPLDELPLVGYPVKPGMTFAFGGLAQSTKAEVLDTSNNPIPGLYVAGNSAGGLFYHNYAGGTGQANAMTFGKIAGEQAAEFADD